MTEKNLESKFFYCVFTSKTVWKLLNCWFHEIYLYGEWVWQLFKVKNSSVSRKIREIDSKKGSAWKSTIKRDFAQKIPWNQLFSNFDLTEKMFDFWFTVWKLCMYGNSLSHIFGKYFVKVTVLLNNLLESWFDEIFFWWERISRFSSRNYGILLPRFWRKNFVKLHLL